jgi:hypothetical protein
VFLDYIVLAGEFQSLCLWVKSFNVIICYLRSLPEILSEYANRSLSTHRAVKWVLHGATRAKPGQGLGVGRRAGWRSTSFSRQHSQGSVDGGQPHLSLTFFTSQYMNIS